MSQPQPLTFCQRYLDHTTEIVNIIAEVIPLTIRDFERHYLKHQALYHLAMNETSDKSEYGLQYHHSHIEWLQYHMIVTAGSWTKKLYRSLKIMHIICHYQSDPMYGLLGAEIVFYHITPKGPGGFAPLKPSL